MITGTIQCHSSNHTKGRSDSIQYIALHYTSNNGDTAQGNCKFFSAPNRHASAHYFVDEHGIWQSVPDSDTAWHCGANRYRHLRCRNANAIGIEMCSRKDAQGNYYIKPETVANAVKLTRTLMDKYGIPVGQVLRHYDVTGKLCPRPWVGDESQWRAFLGALEGEKNMTAEEIRAIAREEAAANNTTYHNLEDIPAWGKATVEKLMKRGGITGDGDGIDLPYETLRLLVINDRMGLYGGAV